MSKLRRIVREEVQKIVETDRMKMVYSLTMGDMVSMYANRGVPSEYGTPYEGPFNDADEAKEEMKYSGFTWMRHGGLVHEGYFVKRDEPGRVYMIGVNK